MIRYFGVIENTISFGRGQAAQKKLASFTDLSKVGDEFDLRSTIKFSFQSPQINVKWSALQ